MKKLSLINLDKQQKSKEKPILVRKVKQCSPTVTGCPGVKQPAMCEGCADCY